MAVLIHMAVLVALVGYRMAISRWSRANREVREIQCGREVCHPSPDVVRKITGHRSRELERYQHLSPLFGAQTVDLIAQVLFSGTPNGPSSTPTDAPPPSNKDEGRGEPESPGREGDVGGVDGTRTRDLRRDRPAF
jgi:hypothetical protein